MSLKVPETARLEIKFVAYDIHLHHILHWLRIHSAGFTSPYPDRKVNNIYFDTHDFLAYADNLAGVSSRTKVRYRWYGNSKTPDAGVLEVKRKRNCFGWKLHFKVNKPPYERGASWSAMRKLLEEQLPPEGRRWLFANHAPVLINRYLRQYFISRDLKIRVTIDTDLEVLEQRFNSCPNLTGTAYKNNLFVVEFKCDRTHANICNRVIQGIPIRSSRHSKYVSGVRTITGI